MHSQVGSSTIPTAIRANLGLRVSAQREMASGDGRCGGGFQEVVEGAGEICRVETRRVCRG